MRGVIEEVKEGKTEKEENPYRIYTVSGEKYSTFAYLNFKEGDEIEFEYVKKGKWNNLIKAELVSKENWGDKNRILMRENLLRTAVMYYQIPTASSDGISEDTIIKTARYWEERYILEEPEEEPKPEEDVPF